MRIVSLLPSMTEIVCLLGMHDALVGISHECDFPASITSLPRVTHSKIPHEASSLEIDTMVRDHAARFESLFDLDVDALVDLQPDCILTQSLCNVCAVSDHALEHASKRLQHSPRIVHVAPNTFEDVLQSIAVVGRELQVIDRAERLLADLRERIAIVRRAAEARSHHPRVVLLEWLRPFFVAGHWNPELIEIAGGHSILGTPGTRSIEVSWEQIHLAQPDVLIIASCGQSIEQAKQEQAWLEAQPGYQQLPAVQHRCIHWFDGSTYFNRPGPRLVDSLEFLARAVEEWSAT